MPKPRSKYGHITPSLPALPPADARYQDRVEATKAAILEAPKDDDLSTLDIPRVLSVANDQMKAAHQGLLRACAGKRHASDLARAYAEVRALKERITDWESNTNLLLEAYKQLLIEQMEAEGVTGLRVEGVGNLSTWQEPYSRVADAAAFRDWFLADPDLRQKATMMWQSIDSLTRQRLLNGEEPPPGIEVYAMQKVRLGERD